MRADTMGDSLVRLEVGIDLTDMRLVPSYNGHYLLIYCRQRIVAMLGPMGGDVEVFEFADVGRMTAMELIERIAPTMEASSTVPARAN